MKLDMGVGSASVAVAASRATKWGSYGGRMKLGLGSMPEGEVSVVSAGRGGKERGRGEGVSVAWGKRRGNAGDHMTRHVMREGQ